MSDDWWTAWNVHQHRLEYTVFPGPAPFIGCTKLDGSNIAPAEAHRDLVDVGHPAAEVDYIGAGWGST